MIHITVARRETKDSREAASSAADPGSPIRRRFPGWRARPADGRQRLWFESACALCAALPASRTRADAQTTGRRSRHRTIFISDTHLGTRGCKAEALADFLAHNDCETLFLVGDIVDGWQLKRRWFWTEAHNRVVAEILRKVDHGTRVIFVPGNHDEFARDYCRTAVRRHRDHQRNRA